MSLTQYRIILPPYPINFMYDHYVMIIFIGLKPPRKFISKIILILSNFDTEITLN